MTPKGRVPRASTAARWLAALALLVAAGAVPGAASAEPHDEGLIAALLPEMETEDADDDGGATLPARSHPERHRSSEAEAGRSPWRVTVRMGPWRVGSEDLSRAFPAWTEVSGYAPRVLDGVVVAGTGEDYPGPHVSREEFPTTHDTHDFTFHVKPDPGCADLLGVQVHDGGRESLQEAIECEWESGLGAGNAGNPLAAANRHGDSGGFFSAGHRRGEALWNWPTQGDRLHAVGHWIWDRGHPPANTELHAPRLVSVTRHLPAVLRVLDRQAGDPPLRPTLATRIDVFASGDDGALWNNRPGQPAFVQRVPMGDRDYVWDVHPLMPPPSPTARLRAAWRTRPGDTFRRTPGAAPYLTALDGQPGVRITLPWKSAKVPDDALFARTLYLYWDEGTGAPAGWPVSAYRVNLDALKFHKSQDVGPGQFRLYTEAAGMWFCANELVGGRDVLATGLGHAAPGDTFRLRLHTVAVVPAGETFRVHTDGWEADGVDSVFGHLFNPSCPRTDDSACWLNANLFTFDVFRLGGRDDPAGEVNLTLGEHGAFHPGRHAVDASGQVQHDVFVAQDGDPNHTYTLSYGVTRCDWRAAAEPGGWVDAAIEPR